MEELFVTRTLNSRVTSIILTNARNFKWPFPYKGQCISQCIRVHRALELLNEKKHCSILTLEFFDFMTLVSHEL
jgi:hypothetical protein